MLSLNPMSTTPMPSPSATSHPSPSPCSDSSAPRPLPHSHFPSGTPPARGGRTRKSGFVGVPDGVGGGVPYRAHVDDLLASPVIEGDGFAVGVTSDEMAKVEVG
jgi:hypothetical protein